MVADSALVLEREDEARDRELSARERLALQVAQDCLLRSPQDAFAVADFILARDAARGGVYLAAETPVEADRICSFIWEG